MTSRPGRPSIAKKVLTEREQQSLGNLPGVIVDEEVLLRFSLKEAIYKAAHPLICQYVGFQEAEVTPFADGTATCNWYLDTKADQKISKLTAHWRRIPGDDNSKEDFFLTTASVYAKAEEA
jgi:4'-phosphopantetheinyl transferase EntD